MPHVTASLFAEYRVPVLAGLSVNGGMYYVGPRPVNSADQAWIGGATIYTAGLRYATRLYGKRVSLQANLENATNKRYLERCGFEPVSGRPRPHARAHVDHRLLIKRYPLNDIATRTGTSTEFIERVAPARRHALVAQHLSQWLRKVHGWIGLWGAVLGRCSA